MNITIPKPEERTFELAPWTVKARIAPLDRPALVRIAASTDRSFEACRRALSQLNRYVADVIRIREGKLKPEDAQSVEPGTVLFCEDAAPFLAVELLEVQYNGVASTFNNGPVNTPEARAYLLRIIPRLAAQVVFEATWIQGAVEAERGNSSAALESGTTTQQPEMPSSAAH